jgi:Phosphoribosylglycinamide synthetase, ATP-grasp (A) domain
MQIDLDTCVGTVCLMHPDAEVVRRDIEFIRYMEDIHGLFEFAPIIENLKRPRGEIVAQQSVVTPSHSVEGIASSAASKKQAHRRVFSSLGQEGLVRQFSTRRPQLLQQLDEWTIDDKSKNVVVFVDPYSTATVVAKHVMNRGFHVVALWTKGFPEAMREHVPVSCTTMSDNSNNGFEDAGKLEYRFELDEERTLQDTIAMIQNVTQGLNLFAVIAGDDLGVDLADALSEALQLPRSNGAAIRKTDKKLQQELVAKAGLRAIRQAGGSDFSDVALFLKKESYPIVLKPARTAGSDGVKLCHTFEDAKDFFGELKDSQVLAALEVPSIVAQEYLVGQEFVVDHVSLDGVHKT